MNDMLGDCQYLKEQIHVINNLNYIWDRNIELLVLDKGYTVLLIQKWGHSVLKLTTNKENLQWPIVLPVCHSGNGKQYMNHVLILNASSREQIKVFFAKKLGK